MCILLPVPSLASPVEGCLKLKRVPCRRCERRADCVQMQLPRVCDAFTVQRLVFIAVLVCAHVVPCGRSSPFQGPAITKARLVTALALLT